MSGNSESIDILALCGNREKILDDLALLQKVMRIATEMIRNTDIPISMLRNEESLMILADSSKDSILPSKVFDVIPGKEYWISIDILIVTHLLVRVPYFFVLLS